MRTSEWIATAFVAVLVLVGVVVALVVALRPEPAPSSVRVSCSDVTMTCQYVPAR